MRSRLTDFAVGAVSSRQTDACVSAVARDARSVVLAWSSHTRINHCNSITAVNVTHRQNRRETRKRNNYFTHINCRKKHFLCTDSNNTHKSHPLFWYARSYFQTFPSL